MIAHLFLLSMIEGIEKFYRRSQRLFKVILKDHELCVGTLFICVLNSDERVGVQVRSWEMEPLRRCLNNCELHDINNTGNLFA